MDPIGAAHPHTAEAQVILERLIAAGERLVTGAAALQGILHRCTAIDRPEARLDNVVAASSNPVVPAI